MDYNRKSTWFGRHGETLLSFFAHIFNIARYGILAAVIIGGLYGFAKLLGG